MGWGWNLGALIVVPALLALAALLQGDGGGASGEARIASESCFVERRAGSTRFAEPELYRPGALLSAAQRSEYFRDGATVLRGAVAPGLISALLEHVPSEIRYQPNAFWNNPWMHSDEFLDFLLYSNLAALQPRHRNCWLSTWCVPLESVCGIPSRRGPRLALRPPGVRRRADPRAAAGRSMDGCGWSTERIESDLPANYTARARVRVVVALAGGAVPGTVVLNQSAYAAGMPEEEASLYWQGRLPHRLPPYQRYLLQERSSLPRLPHVDLVPSAATLVQPGELRAGDVVVFNSCAWHTAPPEASHGGSELMFQPSFAAALSRIGLPEVMGGACVHGLKLGDSITASPGCFPQVFPQSAIIPRGSRLKLQHDGCGRE